MDETKESKKIITEIVWQNSSLQKMKELTEACLINQVNCYPSYNCFLVKELNNKSCLQFVNVQNNAEKPFSVIPFCLSLVCSLRFCRIVSPSTILCIHIYIYFLNIWRYKSNYISVSVAIKYILKEISFIHCCHRCVNIWINRKMISARV